MKSLVTLGLFVLLWAETTMAETAYVTDILRLGLHRAEDTSDAPIRNLVSGTELEVLQRRPNYAEVRTPDGEQGWVKSAFLVAEKPAQLIVAEARQEIEALQQQLAAAEAGRIGAEQETERAVAEMAELVGTAGPVKETIARLRADNEEYMTRLELYRDSVPLRWAAAAFAVAFAGGLLIGVWGLDTYIRRRHGGFRLY